MNVKVNSTLFKGMAMGIAEIIPGVSGGTIAFITGIYEQLMKTIKAFDIQFINFLLKAKYKDAFSKFDFTFIANLGVGMLSGIVIGVFAVSYFLVHYPEPLWGFFFGLILASAWSIGREWDYKNITLIGALFAGIVLAYGVTIMSPSEGNTSYLFIFLSAVIAISAMLLPGVSGSFMLVLLGMYHFILETVKSLMTQFSLKDFWVMLVFAAGLITGAATFSRVFSWLFTRYKDLALAVLTGFLIGSLNKIWPWRNIETIFDKTTGQIIPVQNIETIIGMKSESYKIVSEINVLPGDYWGSPKIFLTIMMAIAGFLVVFLLHFYKKGKV